MLKAVFKIVKIIASVIFFVLSVGVVIYLCYLFGHRVLEGNILGGDTPYHLALMHALNRFYPNIYIWFPFAGAGSSLILGYWSFSYYLAIFGSHINGMSLEQWVRILEFVAVPIICIEIYIYLWIRLKNQIIALVGAVLYPLSSMAWGWISHAGFFSMHMSGIIYVPALLFFDLFLESELTNDQKLVKKRLYLFGFFFSMALGILVHGSFFPNFYLGLPLFAIIRSQLMPRANDGRLISFAKSIKVLLITLPLGILAGAFILIPMQKYFGLQPFTPSYGATDTPYLPWKAFLGFERLSGVIGSLYIPLFMSRLISVFAILGTLYALVKRKFIGALGLTAFFYVWILSFAQYLAVNYEFVQIFVLPVATRAATATGIYLTIVASYGMWSLANIVSEIVLFIYDKTLNNSKSIIRRFIYGVGLLLSVFLLAIIFYKTVIYFGQKQITPPEILGQAAFEGYQGLGTLGFDVPLCKIPGWKGKENSEDNCNDKMPQWTVGTSGADFWTQQFKDDFAKLAVDDKTRVSISPYLGQITFSFTKHSNASMVSAPSGQSIINLEWLGIHDNTLFLDGTYTSHEVSEIAKWNGVKYALFDKGTSEKIQYRYPPQEWRVALESGGVEVKEFINSPGITSLSNKPSVLVIGSEKYQAYVPALQIMIKGALSFDDANIVNGKSKIDDYDIKELNNFDLLLLQGYTYNNKQKAWKLLKDYVYGGGSLFIDTGWQYVSSDWGSGPDNKGKYASINLAEPFPIKETIWSDVGTSWQNAKLNISDDIKLENFGPPAWGDKPWGMALAQKDDLQPWAESVLASGDKVVVALGKFGEGKVVWSGMNIFAHSFDKANDEEYKFISSLINYLLPDGEPEIYNLDYKRINPDKVEFTFREKVSERQNLYFAETYTPYWKAYKVSNNKKTSLEVYRAGPGYISLFVEGVNPGDKIILELKMGKLFFLSSLITVATLFVILLSIADASFLNNKIFGKTFTLKSGKGYKFINEKGKKLTHDEHDDY